MGRLSHRATPQYEIAVRRRWEHWYGRTCSNIISNRCYLFGSSKSTLFWRRTGYLFESLTMDRKYVCTCHSDPEKSMDTQCAIRLKNERPIPRSVVQNGTACDIAFVHVHVFIRAATHRLMLDILVLLQKDPEVIDPAYSLCCIYIALTNLSFCQGPSGPGLRF